MARRTLVVLATALAAGVLAVGRLPAQEAKPAAAKAVEARPAEPKPKVAKVGLPAPGFALEDQDGNTVKLSDFAGKIVVLEWINPDCPYSRRHYVKKTMKSLATKYAPKGVVWLAINTTHYFTNEKNREWVKKHKLPYPILNDQPGDVGRMYGAKTTPDMRIIDAKGKLVYSGAIDDDPRGRAESPTNYVAKALDEVLAGEKVSTPMTKPYGCSVKYAKPLPKAPAFTLEDHTGKKVSLSDFAGKIVVLEWVNPDCPVSRSFYTNGTMKSLATKYAPKGVVWLAINTTHYFTSEKNREWVEKNGLPYPILNDQPGDVGRAYGAKTTPDMRVIDKSGRIAYSGAIDNKARKKDDLVNYVAAALDELLAGKKVSTPRTRPYGCSVKYAKRKK